MLIITMQIVRKFQILLAVTRGVFIYFATSVTLYIRRVIPEHVKDPRAPVDKSRVLISGVTGQIPEVLRIAVKLHRHHYR